MVSVSTGKVAVRCGRWPIGFGDGTRGRFESNRCQYRDQARRVQEAEGGVATWMHVSIETA